MTISSSEIKRNMTILLDDDVYQVIDWQHRQAPKAPPTLTLKVRQISSGNVYEKKLPGNQKLTIISIKRGDNIILYPSNQEILNEGDEISIIGNNSNINKLII